MVYLKQLYNRLDRLAQRQRSPFSTVAQEECVKLLFFNKSYIFIKKDRTEKHWDCIIHRHPCIPQKQWLSFKNTAY